MAGGIPPGTRNREPLLKEVNEENLLNQHTCNVAKPTKFPKHGLIFTWETGLSTSINMDNTHSGIIGRPVLGQGLDSMIPRGPF